MNGTRFDDMPAGASGSTGNWQRNAPRPRHLPYDDTRAALRELAESPIHASSTATPLSMMKSLADGRCPNGEPQIGDPYLRDRLRAFNAVCEHGATEPMNRHQLSVLRGTGMLLDSLERSLGLGTPEPFHMTPERSEWNALRQAVGRMASRFGVEDRRIGTVGRYV